MSRAGAASSGLDRRVEAVRRFNRFYTRRIGVLQEGLLRSPFSLTQGRVLYELAHRRAPTAVDLRRELGLDAGYLSRLLSGFRRNGLVSRQRSETDGRRSLLRLTGRGRREFAMLDARAKAEVRGMLRTLDRRDQARLIDDMRGIETLLGAPPQRTGRSVLRAPRAGDLGWVVHQHGLLYAEEYGWGSRFEALVAGIVAAFVERHDRKRERCWIAESGDGERVGSVFLVKKSKTVARLRLLLVDPKARGSGLGGRLVDECVRFARRAGYRKITLWTQSNLHAARRIYQKAGFRLIRQEPNSDFGRGLVAETWELPL